MKGIFANRGAGFQVIVLLTVMLCGFIIASLINMTVIYIGKEADASELSVNMLLFVQFVASLAMFLFPALTTAFLCSHHPIRFLHLQTIPDIRILLLAGIMTILLSPTISLTGYLNAQMDLPDTLQPLERWLQETEEAAAEITRKMLSQKGVLTMSLNFLVMAVTAGVTEELFFRGTLFSILKKKIRNPHSVIWIIAIIFSAIHFQFYGFVPRMLLGAFLGYLLYWSKSIWVPVAAHFLNNATAIVGMSMDSLKNNVYFTEDLNPEDLRQLMIASAAGLVLFAGCVVYMKRLMHRKKP